MQSDDIIIMIMMIELGWDGPKSLSSEIHLLQKIQRMRRMVCEYGTLVE
jgi:hypothetical protein